MPFITGDTEVLLVDNGPEAEEHRWMLVGQLLYCCLVLAGVLRGICSGGTTEDSTIVALRESVVER